MDEPYQKPSTQPFTSIQETLLTGEQPAMYDTDPLPGVAGNDKHNVAVGSSLPIPKGVMPSSTHEHDHQPENGTGQEEERDSGEFCVTQTYKCTRVIDIARTHTHTHMQRKRSHILYLHIDHRYHHAI